MKSDKEKIDIILFGNYSEKIKELWYALFALKMPHAIVFLSGTAQLRAYLIKRQNKTIIFLSAIEGKNEKLLRTIGGLRAYTTLSIAVYDPIGIVSNIEDLFAVGANIYIHKPENRAELLHTIRQVMVMNSQFASGNFNRETYFLSA